MVASASRPVTKIPVQLQFSQCSDARPRLRASQASEHGRQQRRAAGQEAAC